MKAHFPLELLLGCALKSILRFSGVAIVNLCYFNLIASFPQPTMHHRGAVILKQFHVSGGTVLYSSATFPF